MKKLICAFKVVIAIYASLSIGKSYGQTWEWATAAGSKNINTKADRVADLATDVNGNSYLLSSIHPTEIYVAGTSIPDGKGNGVLTLLSSLDKHGKYRWSKVLGAENTIPKEIKVSANGNVYAFGYVSSSFSTPAYYDADLTTAKVNQGMSLACYDTLGNLKWVRRPDTLTNPDFEYEAMSIDVDEVGNVYMLVSMPPDNIILGSSLKIPSTLPFKGQGAYVLKYSSSGSLLSVTMLKDFSYVYKLGTIAGLIKITYNKYNGGYYVCGQAGSQPLLDSLYIKGLHSDHNLFLISFDANGNLKWSKTNTSTDPGNIYFNEPVRIDESGNIFVAGSGVHSDIFNGYAFSNPLDPSRGNGLPFIMKMDSSGKIIWCTSGGARSFSDQSGFTINKKFAAISTTTGIKNFFGNPLKDTLTVNSSGQDGMYAIVDLNTGITVKMGIIGGTGFYDGITALRFHNEDLYMAGHFESASLKMDGGAVTVGPAKSGRDVYVSKLSLGGFVSVEEIIPTVKNVKIYPNPTHDLINIDGAEKGTELFLFSMSSQQVYSAHVTETITQIPVNNLIIGMYILQLKDKEGNVYSSKVLKQ